MQTRGPITKRGWGPFECLSPGPHGRPEATAPESQAAVYDAGRERLR